MLPFKVDVFSFHSLRADNVKRIFETLKRLFTLDYGKRKSRNSSVGDCGEGTSASESDASGFESQEGCLLAK